MDGFRGREGGWDGNELEMEIEMEIQENSEKEDDEQTRWGWSILIYSNVCWSLIRILRILRFGTWKQV